MSEYSKYLVKKRPDLLKKTSCSKTVIAECLAQGIINEEEQCNLEATSQKFTQNSDFWTIIATRSKCLEKLIKIFDESNQNDVVEILKNATGNKGEKPKLEQSFQEEVEQHGINSGNDSGIANQQKGDFKLAFKGDVDMEDVLDKLLPRFSATMESREVNLNVITQLTALGYFNKTDVKKLRGGNFGTEEERVQKLFEVIQGTERDEIIHCLMKLCNLDRLAPLSKKHRKIVMELCSDDLL